MSAVRDAFKPFYQQLCTGLVAKIRDGTYPDRELLPSERELCLLYNVSRQTVRNALRLMTQQGWVVSQPGKGNIVQNPPLSPGSQGAETETKQIGLICDLNIYLKDIP